MLFNASFFFLFFISTVSQLDNYFTRKFKIKSSASKSYHWNAYIPWKGNGCWKMPEWTFWERERERERERACVLDSESTGSKVVGLQWVLSVIAVIIAFTSSSPSEAARVDRKLRPSPDWDEDPILSHFSPSFSFLLKHTDAQQCIYGPARDQVFCILSTKVWGVRLYLSLRQNHTGNHAGTHLFLFTRILWLDLPNHRPRCITRPFKRLREAH